MSLDTFPPHIQDCLKHQDELDKLLLARVRNGSLPDVTKWAPESREEMIAWDRLTGPDNLNALKEVVHSMPDTILPASAALWKSALTDCVYREFISRSKRGRSALDRIRLHLLSRGSARPVPAELRDDLEFLLHRYDEVRRMEEVYSGTEMSPFMATLLRVSPATQEQQTVATPKASAV